MNEGFTQIPNIIFDKYQKELKASEFSVLLGIIRKTWGWQKKEDRISVSQLMESTGSSKQTVIRCLASLEKKGLISTQKKYHKTTKIRVDIGGTKFRPPSTKNRPQSGTKNRHTKETINKYIDDSPILGGLMQFPNRPK